MANKIFINTNNTLFTYYGESLDLFNPPDESNKELYTTYFKFINSVLAIYRTTRCNGSIPVFWTKITNNEKLTRSPDHASTLRKLDDKQSYFIVLDNSSVLPLEVPMPVNFNEFSCSKNNTICLDKNEIISNTSCCTSPVLTDNSYQDIELTSNYISNISIPISGLSPNKKYYYHITSNLSNWPAKVYPASGFIERNGPTDPALKTTANLELLFSYLPINSSGNVIQNLNNQNHKNVFTFLGLSISEENCNTPILQDNINIVCNDCLGPLASGIKICPELSFETNIVIASGEKTKINLSYKNLDISKNNYYSISSESANWPISISSLSGLIIPKTIYSNPENNKLYGSGLLSVDLSFNSTSSEPYSGWSNLNYTLDPNHTAKFIQENIYGVLNVALVTDTDCVFDPTRLIVICDDCLDANEDSCINTANVTINQTNTNYYDLSQQRPGAESKVDLQCCDQDRHINVVVSNICPEETYDFRFVVNPYIPITPASGSFTPSSSSFSINALTNLNDLEAANIECIITHRDTGDSVSDSIILRCGYCEWVKIKDLKEIYSSRFSLSNLYQPGSSSTLINPANLIASNNDASVLVAITPSGYLYTSEDSGINWNKLQKHNRKIWSSVCLAKNTNDIYLTTGYITDSLGSLFIGSGEIYKSTDYCNTLSPVLSAPSGAYSDIDISNNGEFIAAVHESGIILSSDYGSSWSNISVTGSDGISLYRRWSNISITNSGDKIAASHLHNTTSLGQATNLVAASGRFLISENGGVGWETKVIPFESGRPVVVKYSKDGSTLAGIGIGGNTSTSKEYMYLSYDNGNSWYPRIYNNSIDVLNNFEISNDGSRIILYGNNNIYQSKDHGINWRKYTLSSINSDEILSIGCSSDMDILCSLSQDNTTYSLHLYNCPSYKN